MNIKNKLAKLANTVASGNLDNAVNALLNKAGQLTGMGTTEDYAKKVTTKYHLIIKSRSYSVGTLINAIKDIMPDTDDVYGAYRVYDPDGNLLYSSDSEDTLTMRDVLTICDAHGKKIGSVKEWIMSVGVPLLEKDVKRCTVKMGREKICDLKKYKSFGDLYFECTEGSVDISHQDGNEFQISYNGRRIAKLHTVPINLKNGYADKFVMEYDQKEDEAIAVMLAIAIDTIRHG